jgi:hypothetical protein
MDIYDEFTTTQANLLTAIRTAILTSTDWSQPNAAGNPNLLKAVTTRGANMVVDLNSQAVNNRRMVIGCYTDHDGTTGQSKTERSLWWKELDTGDATKTLRVIVAAGKEHLLIIVEGPRGGEAGADEATYGSMKNYFFMCDIVPYFDTVDVTPAVCISNNKGTGDGNASHAGQSYMCYSSRDADGTAAWNQGKLMSLYPPMGETMAVTLVPNMHGLDGAAYLAPYVVAEDDDGLRGRLSSFFYCGYNFSTYQDASLMQAGSTVEYGGKTYKIIGVNKSNGRNSWDAWGPFGAVYNRVSTNTYRTPLVAVPYDNA